MNPNPFSFHFCCLVNVATEMVGGGRGAYLDGTILALGHNELRVI